MSFYTGFYKIFHRPVEKAYRLTVEGADNIPEGGFIIACNHTAAFDVLVLSAALKRQIRYMAKAELFRIPVVRRLIRALGAYPVNRAGADVASIKTAISFAENGEVVGIFPQGTRRPNVDPRTTEVKSGIGMIAYRAGCSVLPAFIDASAGKTKIFHKTRVIFGEVITNGELGFDKGGKEEYDRAAHLIFGRICELKYGKTE